MLPCTLVSPLKTYLHMKQISPEEMQPVHTSLLCFPWLPAPASLPLIFASLGKCTDSLGKFLCQLSPMRPLEST